MIKKQYFVSVNSGDISEVPIPDEGQFEIIATSEEIKNIQYLFNQMDEETKSGLKYLARPFNEQKVDEKRAQNEKDLIQVYQLLFEYGTRETKENIKSFGILDSEE